MSPAIPAAAQPLVDQARADLTAITVVQVKATIWPSAQLGCGGKQMEPEPTPGSLIMLMLGGQPLEYHASATRVVWCDRGRS